MTIHHRKESPATLETLMSEARFENLSPHDNWAGQAIVARRPEDRIKKVLSALVCLFGSWMGSGKGAT